MVQPASHSSAVLLARAAMPRHILLRFPSRVVGKALEETRRTDRFRR